MASVDFATQSSVLWEFASHGYARPGVAALCLQLQDEHRADVLLLLCAAFMAGRGRRLTAERCAVLDAACQSRRQQLIEPLRALRRAQRPRATDTVGQQALYEALKAAELAAERRQLEMLETLLEEWPVEAAGSGGLLFDNLSVAAPPSAQGLIARLAARLTDPAPG